MPLIEESFNILQALTTIMLQLIPQRMFKKYRFLDVVELSSSSAPNDQAHGIGFDEYLLRPLIVQYEGMFHAMQLFFHEAQERPFLAALGKIPRCPARAR